MKKIMKKRKGDYIPPMIQDVCIRPIEMLLITSPGDGKGNIPETENDDSDNDW